MLELLPAVLPLVIPAVVAIVTELVKRYAIPAMQGWSAHVQQAVVGMVTVIVIAAGAATGVVIPEGLDPLSAEALGLLLYGALGAMGLHGVATPRKA